jgi:murein endopeptidase
LKKPNREKKPIKILKNPTGSVQFWFYKPEIKKTKPNPNRKKTEPNQKNQAKPV